MSIDDTAQAVVQVFPVEAWGHQFQVDMVALAGAESTWNDGPVGCDGDCYGQWQISISTWRRTIIDDYFAGRDPGLPAVIQWLRNTHNNCVMAQRILASSCGITAGAYTDIPHCSAWPHTTDPANRTIHGCGGNYYGSPDCMGAAAAAIDRVLPPGAPPPPPPPPVCFPDFTLAVAVSAANLDAPAQTAAVVSCAEPGASALDLSYTSTPAAASPIRVPLGGQVIINATVRNIGSTIAQNVQVVLGEVRQAVGDLAPGAAAIVKFVKTASQFYEVLLLSAMSAATKVVETPIPIETIGTTPPPPPPPPGGTPPPPASKSSLIPLGIGILAIGAIALASSGQPAKTEK